MTCSYEYVTEDWNKQSFILFAFICNYCIPLALILCCYTAIIKAIFFKEDAMKRARMKISEGQEGQKVIFNSERIVVGNFTLN